MIVFEHRRSLRKVRILELASYLFSIPLFLGFAAYPVFVLNAPPGILFGKAMFVVIGLVIPFLVWNIVRLNHGAGEGKPRSSPMKWSGKPQRI